MSQFHCNRVIVALFFDFVLGGRLQIGQPFLRLLHGFLFIFHMFKQTRRLFQNAVAHLQFQSLVLFAVGIGQDMDAQDILANLRAVGSKAGHADDGDKDDGD